MGKSGSTPRFCVLAVTALWAAVVTARVGFATIDATQEHMARSIHQTIITIDSHIDIPPDFGTEAVDPGVEGRFQNDLPKMERGGLDAAFFIVFCGQGELTTHGYAKALKRARTKLEGIRRMTYDMYPDRIELAYNASDVERIHREGKLIALIGMENAYPLGEDLALLDEFYAKGVRYLSLTHNGHNQFADAAVEMPQLGDDGPKWNGLSPLGREAVGALNRLGVMVDVSHASKSATMDIIELSKAPIIASHSSIRAIADHPRNLDDEQLLAIRDNGGVVQVTALDIFVKTQPPGRAEAIRSHRSAFGVRSVEDMNSLTAEELTAFEDGLRAIEERYPRANVKDLVDHIVYAVDLIGIDHVGISSDFDGGGGIDGWNDSSETFNVTLELVRRGFTKEEIEKLWGGNLLRVMREVYSIAHHMKAVSDS